MTDLTYRKMQIQKEAGGSRSQLDCLLAQAYGAEDPPNAAELEEQSAQLHRRAQA